MPSVSPLDSRLDGHHPDAASSASGVPFWAWMLLAAALVSVRSLPYAVWGTLAFDADQAVVGLMSKHAAEFRALPVYQYGFQYVVMVSVYVTAPFMWIFGATPFALKLPLVFMNVGVAAMLLLAMRRAGLRPPVAVLLALPVLLPSAVSSAGLMDALGMTVEPAVFVLALWHARRSPIAFGIVAALGFHVREFVAYGVAAALAVDVVGGFLWTRQGRRHWVEAAIAGLGTSALLAGLTRFASVRGPGTSIAMGAEGNLSTLGAAFCFVPQQAVRNIFELGASYLGLLWGPTPAPLSDAAVQTGVHQGLPWAWPIFGVVLLLATARLVWYWRRLWHRRHEPAMQLAVFLTSIGAQAVLVYAVSRCGPISVLTIRYALLGLFIPTGIVMATWLTEPTRAVRRTLGATFIGLAALNLWPHVNLWREQWVHPMVSNRAQLGAALEAKGLRYARSDYWTAYYVAFMTQERVIVGSDTLSRIESYERALAGHASEVVRIETRPCDSSPAIVPGYYVCREHAP